MKYHIEIKPGAEDDMYYYSPYAQKIIVKAIFTHLQSDAAVETKKKKQLRPNPIAPWELKIGEYRVFYETEGREKVNILAVGHKKHNELFIQGKKVEL